MNTTRTLLDMAAKALGGSGTERGGVGSPRRQATLRTPPRGLNRVGDGLSDFRISSFDISLGAVTLLVIGAALVVPALSSKK